MNKNLQLIGIIAVLLGLAFNFIIFGHDPGAGFPIYIGLLLTGLSITYYSFRQRPDGAIIILSLLLLFFSGMIAVRANELITLLNIGLTAYLLLLLTSIAAGKKMSELNILGTISLGFLPVKLMGNSFQAIADLSTSNNENSSRRFTEVLRGVVITLPIALFFVAIFSQADTFFERHISDAFKNIVSAESVIRFMLSVIAACFTGGALLHVFHIYEQKQGSAPPLNNNNYPLRLGKIETSILLGTINTIFFAFIIIQFTYLFGVSPSAPLETMNYSEYVRRGFQELCFAAGAAFLLIFAVDLAKKIRTASGRWFSIALILQVYIVMASAIYRLWMYEQAYGFTELRFYSHAFIVWLSIIFVILLWKIAQDIPEQKFIFASLIVSLIAAIALNILNPDLYIAQKNLKRYYASGKIDIEYMASLSEDALPAFKQLAASPDQNLKEEFIMIMRNKSGQRLNGPRDTSWQAFNLAQSRFRESDF